jgi:CheY-like chemotaxis protein
VVEDHEDTAEIVSLLLRQEGQEVEVAPDGQAAMSAVRAHHPDVVLLDLGLPDIDGWQVARQVHEVPAEKRPLLVAVSGQDGADARRRSAEAGIDLHLAKPVDLRQLRQLLARFRQVIEPQQSA